MFKWMLIRLVENNSVSFGEGVEREVIYFVFLGFVGEKKQAEVVSGATRTTSTHYASRSRRIRVVSYA